MIEPTLVPEGARLPVELSRDFVPGAACVPHYDGVGPSSGLFRSYVISIRADRDPTFLCEAEIVQNPAAAAAPE